MALQHFAAPGVILMYHRVATPARDPWQLSVSPAHFDEHVQVLKKHGRLVTMSQIPSVLRRTGWGRKTIALTFDDGYADNHQTAWPILQKHDAAATFFITSGAIDGAREYWWDEIGKAVFEPATLPDSIDLAVASSVYHWRVDADNPQRVGPEEAESMTPPPDGALLSRDALYFAVWRLLSGVAAASREPILAALMRWSGQPPNARGAFRTMTSAELQDVASAGLVEIGAHSVSHPFLSRLSAAEQETEVAGSKTAIEALVNRPVRSFAYPHGAHDAVTVGLVGRSGYTTACTVESRRLAKRDDPLRLPRISVGDWPGDELEARLQTHAATRA